MLAVPNYARMNRVAQEHPEIASEGSVDYAPGATNNNSNKNKPAGNAGSSFQGATTPPNSASQHHYPRKVVSKVWMQSLA